MLPSGSVRLAVTGTPTRGCVRDSVTTPTSSSLVTVTFTSMVSAVAVDVGGPHRYFVYVVRVGVRRASRSPASP